VTYPAAGVSRWRSGFVDRRGRTVRDFDVEHTRRMHFIVVRRDMTGFRHLGTAGGRLHTAVFTQRVTR
jgi:hypothetical protein